MGDRTDIAVSDIFISWTSADLKLKNKIVTYLLKKGLSFMDSERYCTGDYREWSEQAVSACSVCLLLVTSNFRNSKYMKLEIDAAKKLDDFRNRIIPVFEDSELKEKSIDGLEFCSYVEMDNREMTDEKLEEIFSKVNYLIINRYFSMYREKTKPSFIRLLPLHSGVDASKYHSVSFDKTYIERTITKFSDDNELIQSYSEPSVLMKENEISFICGPGGSGKTQYLKHILLCAGDDTLPFIISCEKYNASGKELFSYLYNQFYNNISRVHSYSERNFSRLIGCKKLLLMFDGLDEIPGESATRNLIQRIEDFYKSYSGNIALIFTSRNRKDSESVFVHGKKSTNYYIDALSEDEAYKLGNNLFMMFKESDRAEEFYLKIKEVDDDIRFNPLLLTQLAIVYECSGELPQTTYEILKSMVDIILKLDDEKGLLSSDFLKNIRSVLKKFARKKYDSTLEEKNYDAIKIFKSILKKDYADYETKAELLVEYLKNRAILTDGEFYHKMVLEFFTAADYYDEIFNDYDEIENTDALNKLLDNYQKPYWTQVITLILAKADAETDEETTEELYDIISNNSNVQDYTLLLDICNNLKRFKSVAQTTVLKEILYKSAEKIYPPYGPLFYYVPEYNMYPQLLKAAVKLQDNARALALVRDVCFIFGQYDRISDITDDIDGCQLYDMAKKDLSGVRNALCQLFYTGKTNYVGGKDIYPKCFNVDEAISFMDKGYGVCERKEVPFEDELGLYEHEFTECFNGELIGLVSCPYNKPAVDKLFEDNYSRKVLGIIFTSVGHNVFNYLSIYRKKLKVIYFPEDCDSHSNDYKKHLNLNMNVFWTKEYLLYIRKSDKVFLPGEITELQKNVLRDFDSLEMLVLGEGVTKIHEGAFGECLKLKSIEFPESLLGSEMFFSLPPSLREAIVPRSLYDSFAEIIGADNIESETDFSENKVRILIKEDAQISYKGKSNLTKIKVKGKYFIESAFENCINLESVGVPSSQLEIPNRAFYGCVSLTNVTMSNHIHTFGESSFEGCTAIQKVYFPATTQVIMKRAFKDCVSLSKIYLPDSVRIIEDEAFMNCSSVERIHLSPAIEYLSPTAFSGCVSLKSIDIPKNLNLTLQLPDGVEIKHYIPSLSFQKKVSLKGKAFVDECAKENLIINGCVDFQDHYYVNNISFAGNKSVISVNICEGVDKIPNMCFFECDNLEKIEFSSTMLSINDSSFSGCSKLTDIVLPKKLRKIYKNAFMNCTSLKNISFGPKLLSIGKNAFCGCSSIEKLVLPNSLRKIDNGAFKDCTNLKSVDISANFEDDIERIFGDIDRSIIKFIEG